MPELLVVHEFARRANAYVTTDAACIIIFNTQHLQKKKYMGRQEQGYLIYAKPEEIYLRNVYPLLTIPNFSIGAFLLPSLCFLGNPRMKFIHPLFLLNLAAISYYLPLQTSTFAFFLLSMGK